MSVAVEIAEAEDADVRQVLHGAYERNLLHGQSLLAANRLIVRDAAATRRRLLFMVEALRALMADEGFVTLLRVEGLLTMPAKLAEHVGGSAGGG